jgi:NAD(P)-dependent dehydrogenase (short-subunit alcohol dehydrogenase family)
VLLEDKRVIVTGGVTGIGKATVIGMVHHGATVVSMSRKAPEDDGVQAVLRAASNGGQGSATHIKCDVSDQNDVNAAFDEAIRSMGGLDALVHCAGAETEQPAETLTKEILQPHFEVNVYGTIFTNIAVCRHYKENGGGAIINYASFAGVSGMPGLACYSAAKGAVVAFTRTIAKDWAPYGIRSNIVCPLVMTELAQEWYDNMDPDRFAEIEGYLKLTVPLGGKLGDVEDAANLNVFLASDMATFIHGQTIGVDGGRLMPR